MAYVGIDAQGARALSEVLRDTATRAETVRRQTVGALKLADLTSQAPLQLGLAQDGFATLGAGLANKADLAEQFTVDPQRLSQSLGVPVDDLRAAITAMVGLRGPTDVRAVLIGLAPPGADPPLDAALERLGSGLLPALLAGQKPALDATQVDALRVLALRLGIRQAGPSHPVATGAKPRTGTEVFWQDFWADGRTPEGVLSNPDQLYAWVSGTFELDRRLALSAGLPELVDVLDSFDFATGTSADRAGDAAGFAAINGWLPAFLVGRDATPPDATQLAQTLAFATRVGWADPGTASTVEQRFVSAIAYLRANRMLQSALLPTGFQGDPEPLAFLNAPGIAQILALGRQTGVLDDAIVAGLAGLVDQVFGPLGTEAATAPPPELTQPMQQQLFAVVASLIPRARAASPAIQAQFIASLGYLRQATTAADLRQRIVAVVAAFRTLGITGPPALTERQLIDVVGPDALGVLGQSRLRLRAAAAVQRNPEFLLVARQWGVPGGHKQDLGKYKFTWSFNDLGELAGIRRKKKSTLSRIVDTIKSVGKAILASWKDNPFKAIFQVGKIALGAVALIVPGLQALGAASLALSVAEAGYHALQGDWLSAIGAGLSAFTAGATDIFGAGAQTIVSGFQNTIATDLLGSDVLSVVKDAKRVFDIGTSIYNASQAKSLLGAITNGIGAVATTIGSGGQLLGRVGAIGKEAVDDLFRIGMTIRDANAFVTPAAGLLQSLDKDNALGVLGNGLSIISAGARALTNPLGAFTSPSLFSFTAETRDALRTIASGTGVAANVSLAINAADAGNSFLAGSFLAQAVQAVNDPLRTPTGSAARIGQRVAEVGAALEAVFDRTAAPATIAPILLKRLNDLVDSATTKAAKTSSSPGLINGSGQSTLINGSEQSTLIGDGGQSTLVGGDGDDRLSPDETFTVTQSAGQTLTSASLSDAEFATITLDDQVRSGNVLDGESLDTLAGGGIGLSGATIGGRSLDGQDLPAMVPTAVGTAHIPLPEPETFTIADPGASIFGDPPVRGGFLPFFWPGQPEMQLNTEKPADHFPEPSSEAFTRDLLLDGEVARRWEFALGLGFSSLGKAALQEFSPGSGLSLGATIAARGPSSTSFGLSDGFSAGLTLSESEVDPVTVGTEKASLSYSLLGGKHGSYGAINLESQEGTLTSGDIFLGLRVPDLSFHVSFPDLSITLPPYDPDNDPTFGFRLGYGPDGLIARWADRTDFPTFSISVKAGGMVYVEEPKYGDDAFRIMSWLSKSPPDEVAVSMQVPAGTRMSFGADPSVTSAATPGFPYEPGEDSTRADTGTSSAVPPGLSFVDGIAPVGTYPGGDELVSQDWWGNLSQNVQEWTEDHGDYVPGWTDDSWGRYLDQSSTPAPSLEPPSTDFLDVQPYVYDSSSFDTSDMLSTMDSFAGDSYDWAE